jgi:DNA polymerase-1
MKLVFDIETDGLRPTMIHCICAQDVDTGQTWTFRSDHGNIDNFPSLVTDGTVLIGHNILGYDLPVLRQLKNWNFDRATFVDTLVLSRLANPSRDGGHSLGNLSKNLEDSKGVHTDWSVVSDEMVEYCVRDVAANVAVYKELLNELRGFEEGSIKLEHDVQSIVQRQVRKGWVLNSHKCYDLLATLKQDMLEVESQVHTRFVPKVNHFELLPVQTKSGALGKMGQIKGDTKKTRLTDDEYNALANGASSVVRTISTPFNLGSRQQIGEYLQEFGWKPEKFTPTGQAIVDEKTLGTVDIPEAQLIARYLLLQKRIAQVQSWLEAQEDDNRVHGYVNTNGAVTGRMTHRSPNMAQVPAVKSPFGYECRDCWEVAEGYKLVGCDASGLELRMLAHYMNDKDYTKEVLEGDIHSANQRAAGLATRDQAKTFIYAFLYGAGDAKIGSIVGGTANQGRKLKERFLRNTPALGSLRDAVGKAAARGFVKGLDGRRVYIRSEHAALNSLLQSAGAIVMKKALVLLDGYAKQYKLDYEFVGNIHDEFQVEVREDQAEFFGTLAVGSIQQAGKQLGLRCALDGEYKVGNSWAETH